MSTRRNARRDDLLLAGRGLSKRFGRRTVLRDVSLELRRGELVGVVGENGSGKTTLLRILVGLLGRDAGELRREGTLGYCPQEPLVFGRLTVEENLRYFAAAYALAGWERRASGLLERYRFAGARDQLVSEVSGGTRQKLNLAIALLHDPEIVVLDEPYSGLDWEGYLAFWAHADELRGEGKGVLVVSHFLHDRERFDRIYTLERGELRCASAA